MKEIRADLAIIGGGPAGLAAALEAKKQGVEKVVLLERDSELGGILQQCIHDGFGLHRFGELLSGGQYAQRFIDEVVKTDVRCLLDTMVLEITSDKTVYACNSAQGMMKIRCGAIVLATGCRERTASQVFIYGSRPAGVLTAGAVQRYINMEGYLPGKKAVILGSGDIGLIMARRMELEGMEVAGVYEVMPHPGGLTRNIVQCLDEYGIPLYLSTTVVAVHGKQRLTGVTVAKVDANRVPIPGTEQEIDCDLLVLAVGLIPENELATGLGVALDPQTKGPVIDPDFMTSVPGIFAAGNAVAVFDLVDYVSDTGEMAARGAARYLAGQWHKAEDLQAVIPGENVSFVVPQKSARADSEAPQAFYLRVQVPAQKARLLCLAGQALVAQKSYPAVAPPEMLRCAVGPGSYGQLEVEVVTAP